MTTIDFDATSKMEAIKVAFEDFNIALQNIDPVLWADGIVVMGIGPGDKFCRVFYDDGTAFVDDLGNASFDA